MLTKEKRGKLRARADRMNDEYRITDEELSDTFRDAVMLLDPRSEDYSIVGNRAIFNEGMARAEQIAIKFVGGVHGNTGFQVGAAIRVERGARS